MYSAAPTLITRFPLAAYFTCAYAISWLIWAPLWLPAFGVNGLPAFRYQHALGALGPISAAFLVSLATSGRPGAWNLLRRMGRWRGQLAWLAVAVGGPALLLVLGVLGAALVGHESISVATFGRSREFPLFSAVGFLAYNVVSFGFGEEVGWRGFALPRLQARHSALVASLLLTVGWALWHVPLFFYRPGYTSMGLAGIAGWLFSLLTGAILLTWLYNESRGSLLVVALFHAAVDVVFTSEISSPMVVNAAGALITIWGVLVLAIAGPRYLTRRRCVEQAT